ncbi:hypothetical protein SISNIDRAFT_106945 [Sistotremastrum niveocremeum HHB9708]|uniref:Uncharacterized protein n=1 Tax=Sistotremastrum niveocremeum HHB9708 TaxID=1314777 RepID=A0A164TXK7_9AGAM|nr:hypothetical protein SISNIDRAFT_106945 [Sistotremastrum niveocremeum HHB9708]
MVSFTQYRAFLALSLWLTGLAHGQADTTSSTTTAPTPSLSLCCQTYTAYYPNGFTLCSTITNGKQPNPTDRTSDVPPTPGLSETIYKLVTIHCGGSIPTTCPQSYTWSTVRIDIITSRRSKISQYSIDVRDRTRWHHNSLHHDKPFSTRHRRLPRTMASLDCSDLFYPDASFTTTTTNSYAFSFS